MRKYSKLKNIVKYYKDNKTQLISDYKDYVVEILSGNETHYVKTPIPFESFVIHQYRTDTYPDFNLVKDSFLHLQKWMSKRYYVVVDKILNDREFINRTEHNLLEEILLEYCYYEII